MELASAVVPLVSGRTLWCVPLVTLNVPLVMVLETTNV